MHSHHNNARSIVNYTYESQVSGRESFIDHYMITWWLQNLFHYIIHDHNVITLTSLSDFH